MITTFEKLVWAFLLLFMAWGANKVYASEPHVIYDCYYAEKLIYDYNVSGSLIWDMDTGHFYNINYCLGINAPEIIWEGK
jgi:hypothetical protein